MMAAVLVPLSTSAILNVCAMPRCAKSLAELIVLWRNREVLFSYKKAAKAKTMQSAIVLLRRLPLVLGLLLCMFATPLVILPVDSN